MGSDMQLRISRGFLVKAHLHKMIKGVIFALDCTIIEDRKALLSINTEVAINRFRFLA